MKASKTLFSLMLLFLTLTMQAQKVSVSGQVLDSVTGEGIPFAGIFIKGTTTGVSTDDQGVFAIDVSKGDILLVSSIGYVEREIAVEAGKKLVVKLDPDSQAIDETIVVAYGVQKKSSFVGSAAQVSGERRCSLPTSPSRLKVRWRACRHPAHPEPRALPPASSSVDAVRCRHHSRRFWSSTECRTKAALTPSRPMTSSQ